LECHPFFAKRWSRYLDVIDASISNVLSEAQRKRAALQEGAKKTLLPLKSARMSATRRGEGIQFECRVVGQGVHLQVAPDGLHRIQLRSVWRKMEDVETRFAADEAAGFDGTMGEKAIPNKHDWRLEMPQKIAQKGNVRVGGDVRVRMEPEIETHVVARRGHTQRGNDRHPLMESSALVKYGCDSAPTPCATDERCHHQAAFVKKDQPAFQTRAPFFMRGQSFLIQPRMRASSRSRARRSGFWGVHPNARRILPT